MAESTSILSILTAIGGLGAGGWTSWFIARRKTSGMAKTSDAETLWQQAAGMREWQQAQIDKLAEQRDKLIDSQSSQIIPLLSSVNSILKSLGETIQASAEETKQRDNHMSELLSENAIAIASIRNALELWTAGKIK